MIKFILIWTFCIYVFVALAVIMGDGDGEAK